MSIVAPDQKKPWILIAAAIGIVVAVATTIALVDLPGERLLSRRGAEGGETPVTPELPQATWEMSIHASGVDGKLSPAQEKAVDRQRPRLRSLVMKIYDSLFVHPNRLSDTLKENFSEPAAIALKRAKAGATEPGKVSTTLRRASIGIQAGGGARLAVASVTVRAVGDGGDRPVVHRSALWLERAKSGWKVVAFDLQQGPLADTSGAKGKAGARNKDGKKKTGRRG